MWQPIETAPLDGTNVLLFCPKYKDFSHERYGGGFFESSSPYGAGGYLGYWVHDLLDEPTHWMPLPQDPIDATRPEA